MSISPRFSMFASALIGFSLTGQEVPPQVDLQAIKQALQAQSPAPAVVGDALPKGQTLRQENPEGVQSQQERRQAEEELRALKAKETGPRRFAADLFDSRATSPQGTEGGIAEDYVLGVGDQLRVNVFGSATFEIPAQVDGRGEVVLPGVGVVRVSGLSLTKARAALQAKVAQNFSRASVDVSVSKLREVRVFLLGEVYRPGSYLVPSLSSLVNVLGLGGGPTPAGSYRQIRVMRGGKAIYSVDLYPLRAEGLGNLNFSLQSGDTIFVPLAFHPVVLEGAFVRVTAEAEARLRQKREPQPGAEGDRPRTETPGQPLWLERWQVDGEAPRMQFEMLPGETVADALRFAGGLVAQAFTERLSLKRLGADGKLEVADVSLIKGSASVALERGDVLSALPLREQAESAVQVRGWVRVPGVFARREGLRVRDLLKRDNQLLPDTYLGRGEIVRTAEDGTTSYLAFDVAKAMAGDPAHDLLLADRDRVDLHRLEELRLRRTVRVLGPVSRPGTFDFHEGMRASDLLFRAGVPLQQADRFVAELAHTREGKPSEVRSLDLARLLSTEQSSPVNLQDDALNPKIEPFDQLSLFEKPDYRPHRVVKVSGQVARPGSYSLDRPGMGLRELVARAGGLTAEAMPKGAIFLRRLGNLDPAKLTAQELAGIQALDPTGNGINEILERLGETKRQPVTGQLLKTPVLHGLAMGAVSRMVVNLPAVVGGDAESDVALLDGDELVIPRQTDAAYVVGETASPFAAFKVKEGATVRELLRLAGGTTRNADTWHIRLLKADGRILDRWVSGRKVEPGDAVLVPSKVRRDVSWQENLAAITNLAVMYAAIKR